jgi:cyclopropane fatty-acyl-phospholipid synthase-like methyltransferase
MTETQNTEILCEVAEYYSSKLAEHGETPQGVDWNGNQSQELRFEQLCKIINVSEPFSVSDLGCGYGALYDFLAKKYVEFTYHGMDVSESMIVAANKRYQHQSNTSFSISNIPDKQSDFSLASGIFNVRMNRTDEEWLIYIKNTLDVLNQSSRYGFAFNCLTSYSDKEKMRDYLYYADPCELFDFCKRHYSKDIALLHDYGLYEFTILVRK